MGKTLVVGHVEDFDSRDVGIGGEVLKIFGERIAVADQTDKGRECSANPEADLRPQSGIFIPTGKERQILDRRGKVDGERRIAEIGSSAAVATAAGIHKVPA